jgi:hypothetical protein
MELTMQKNTTQNKNIHLFGQAFYNLIFVYMIYKTKQKSLIVKLNHVSNERKTLLQRIKSQFNYVRFQVTTEASTKMAVFDTVALCSLVKSNDVSDALSQAEPLKRRQLLPHYTAKQPRKQPS